MSNTRLTTFIHSGTVYTIGTTSGYDFHAGLEVFDSVITIANGRGISYPRISDGKGISETVSIQDAIRNIMEVDPIVSYALTTADGRGHTTYFDTLDEAVDYADSATIDVCISEVVG